MKANYKIKTIDLKTRPKLSEVDNLQCNNRKIKKIANWKPKINLEQGLKKTIEWIKSNQSHYSDTYSL